jgi:general secretion pathway protein N
MKAGWRQWAGRWRRRPGDATAASRLDGLSQAIDSRWQGTPSSVLVSGMSMFASTGYAGDSRWVGTGPEAEQRWLRQWRASRRWAIWGVALGSCIGLVVFAPARWVASGLEQASQGHFLLAEAEGSLWDGSALPVLTGGAGSRDASVAPSRLFWRLRPRWNGLALELRQPCCIRGAVHALLQPGIGRYTLSIHPSADGASPTAAAAAAHMGQWPTSWLSGLGTPMNTLQPGGTMTLASQGLKLHSAAGRLRIDGGLTIELQDLSSRVSPLPVLGSYRLELQGQGADAAGSKVVVQTLSGPLQISGDGQWSGQRLRFRGQAQAAPGHEQSLANLLNIIGRRQGALSVISIG